jgi:hypothetical protein
LTSLGPCVLLNPLLLKSLYLYIVESSIPAFKKAALLTMQGTQGPNDVNAVASAYVKYQNKGIERIIGGSLSFSATDTRHKYVGVVERGLTELGKLLEGQKVL